MTPDPSGQTPRSTDDVLAELHGLRRSDPPTHGGRVLSYVYDHGRPELDVLAAAATTAFLPVNGLDPTTFTSVATLERDLVAFTRSVLRSGSDVVGSVTSGGTESCLLAVKSARDRWVAERDPGRDHSSSRPALVIPTTGHPAFRKACHYLGLDLHEVPVDVRTGAPSAADVLAHATALDEAGEPPALVVLSAPSYPFGVLDPVDEVAPELAARGIALHVDACIGGFLLPWWPGAATTGWDFAVPGVTSISTDLHKYGFAPKGASVVLYRGRERHRAQYYATAEWPGYPIVNPTVLGSRSATAMAAAWAITQMLGDAGYAALVARTANATRRVRQVVDGIEGLRVLGDPAAGLLALVTDDTVARDRRVDPFVLVDRARERGFLLQSQPGLAQRCGEVLPRSAHLTLTPVSDDIAEELGAVLVAAADAARGHTAPAPDPGLVARVTRDGLPAEMAGVMSTLEALPKDVVPGALIDLLADVIDPG